MKRWLTKTPQQVRGGEAQSADYEHPYPDDDVDAALGDGTDAALSLAATSAKQGVEAEGEARHAYEREQETEG